MDEDMTPNNGQPPLSLHEKRVLGSLIEKEMTTPDYYPLTLNALVNACNQRSNRNPVLEMDHDAVNTALESLRAKKLGMMFHGADSRVPRHKHTLDTFLTLEPLEKAVLCELWLRGHQTAGELRARCERMTPVSGLEAVEAALQGLLDYPGGPLVAKLPRRPGQKEQRHADLFGELPEAEPEVPAPASVSTPAAPAANPASGPSAGEIETLRREVDDLKTDLARLREEFDQFRAQF